MEETKFITIPIEKYNELIKMQDKYMQYKRFVYENSTNAKFAKAMTMLEHKDFYEITKEMEEKK